MADLTVISEAGDRFTEAVFEDNGNVAYCYILENGAIKSDVWIYNRTKAPNKPPWKNGSEPPYLNPEEYASDVTIYPRGVTDVCIKWIIIEGKKPMAVVEVFGDVLGYISADTKPGYAKLAKKDGPLAKTTERLLGLR